jgi:hypothetical protein
MQIRALVSVAAVVLVGATATALITDSPSEDRASVPAGSTQFVLSASAGRAHIDPNCYLPKSAPSARTGAARFVTWRLMSNSVETTITTPPEATSRQNTLVLSCLRERGLVPRIRAGSDFHTN